MNEEQEKTNLEDTFQNLFGATVSGTGEEELLRLAASYAQQYTAKQIRIITYLDFVAGTYEVGGLKDDAKAIRSFVDTYKELKKYNHSDIYVMKALEMISLRKFINENTLRINVEKK